MKKSLAVAVGFLVGLVLFAIGREIALDERSWPQLLSGALRAVGRLAWVDTTLVTGLAAVTAAVFSIRAVGAQIKASDEAVQRQIRSADTIEKNRLLAKRDANRAVMPLTLSSISRYSEANVLLLDELWEMCQNGFLPRKLPETAFANLPTDSIDALKELVEVLTEEERYSVRQLLVEIQIEHSRLQTFIQSQRRDQMIAQHTIGSHIMGQCAIHARASSFYRFARWKSDRLPTIIRGKALYDALFLMGAYRSQEDLNEFYELSDDGVWDPYEMRDTDDESSDPTGEKTQ